MNPRTLPNPPGRACGADRQVLWCTGGLVLLVAAAAFALRAARTQVDANNPSEAGSPPPSLRLDPNTASWSELASLPGLGETLARRIVGFRDGQPASLRRVFRRIEDLQAVPGIGPGKAAALAGYLRFNGPVAGR